MAAPFDYEDLQEEHIRSLEKLNDRPDPTGKLNELRIPPLRTRQQASRPKFYEPSQHNPTGNPQKRPVTLAWKDTALHEISDEDASPWLFLHYAGDKLKELDDGNNGPGFVQMQSEPEASPELSEANGFISLAVDESRVENLDFKYSGDGFQLQAAEKYSIGFRGCRVHWWRWGTLEECKGLHKEVDTGEHGFVTIPASNFIDVSVVT